MTQDKLREITTLLERSADQIMSLMEEITEVDEPTFGKSMVLGGLSVILLQIDSSASILKEFVATLDQEDATTTPQLSERVH